MEVQCNTVLNPVQHLNGATAFFGVLVDTGPIEESEMALAERGIGRAAGRLETTDREGN